MTEVVVVEVGPCTVRGPNVIRQEDISSALDSLDDDIALLDERPVPVQRLWEDVLGTVVGDVVEDLLLVCPTWWPRAWVERVRAAALTAATSVTVQRRTERLRDRVTTIIELAPDFAVVSHPGVPIVVRVLREDPSAVIAAAAGAAGVLIDVPVGLGGGEVVGASIADCLRGQGIPVDFADEDAVLFAPPAPDVDPAPERYRHRRSFAVLGGALSILGAGFALSGGAHDGVPSRLLMEGRVAVLVPADWTVQRVTSGPGSARVQVVSPDDAAALHITQAIGPPDPALESTARSLRSALEAEPRGVFVDFKPSDRRADKPAVTYRELRADHHVAWAVQIDGQVRIAIGCQSAPGRDQLVRQACDAAIRSAHAIDGKDGGTD